MDLFQPNHSILERDLEMFEESIPWNDYYKYPIQYGNMVKYIMYSPKQESLHFLREGNIPIGTLLYDFFSFLGLIGPNITYIVNGDSENFLIGVVDSRKSLAESFSSGQKLLHRFESLYQEEKTSPLPKRKREEVESWIYNTSSFPMEPIVISLNG